jgi:hypothetical protein
MPCKLNQNLICLYPEPLSKGLETNLKLLMNKNARFHWTLLLGPLSKVALSLHVLSQTWFFLFFSQFCDIENIEKNYQNYSNLHHKKKIFSICPNFCVETATKIVGK